MRAKPIWTVQSFFTCFFWNTALVTALFFVTREILQGIHAWTDPLLAQGMAPPSEEVRRALEGLFIFLHEIETWLAPALFGGGAAVTLILWLFILFQGQGFARRYSAEALPTPPKKEAPAAKKPAVKEPQPATAPAELSPQPAVQMLSLLQREGRFIDFLQEDLSLYQDDQIGAAVRSIHQGCKTALQEHVELKPILSESEGDIVTVPAGFDARTIRLTGNVAGDPPFKGVLRHRGWQVAKIQLPQPTSVQTKEWVLAPAEVEMEG